MRPLLAVALLCVSYVAPAETVVTDIVPKPGAPYAMPPKAELPDLQKRIEQYMELPPKAVRAHPAAKYFPGEVTSSERVTKKVDFNYNAYHRWDADAPNAPNLATSANVWQETGLYAAPGEIVTVEVGEIPASRTLEIVVGCHMDRLFVNEAKEGEPKRKNWLRFPLIWRKFRMSPGTNRIANAFGGQIFIHVAETEGGSAKAVLRPAVAKASAEFANAVAMPTYVEGKDTAKSWKRSLASSPAPWGTIVSKCVVLHVPREDMEKMEDPGPLIRWWDKAIGLEDDLVALRRHGPERLVPDLGLAAGFMHSGYPFMCHMNSGHDMVDLAKMEKDGNWGFFHELGHNHQSRKWTFHEGGSQHEVTCNIFSMYCMEKMVGVSVADRQGRHGDIDSLLARRLADPPDLGYAAQLSAFAALVRAHGWEPMRTTLRSYAEPLDVKGEPALKNVFVQRYGMAAKSNVAPFFAQLGYPISDETRARLGKFPVFDPKEASAKK